jgi:hypothetical protein
MKSKDLKYVHEIYPLAKIFFVFTKIHVLLTNKKPERKLQYLRLLKIDGCLSSAPCHRNENHRKPSKTIENHRKPSKTIENHRKPSKTIENHAIETSRVTKFG